MKYLEYPNLNRINAFLRDVNVGDHVTRGVAEAYSCKLAGVDKKLSKVRAPPPHLPEEMRADRVSVARPGVLGHVCALF